MMGGINQDGSSGASRQLPPRDDREILSALLDGELPGDAARFALKRLSHDVHWRETAGRWQLIGDAMRGEAVSMAPADFAANVARALGACSDAEPVGAASATGAPVRSVRQGRWMGGAALAASLAIAAVLVVRPFQATSVTQPTPEVASAGTAILPATPAAVPKPAAPALPAAPRLVAGGDTAAAPMPATVRSVRARAGRPVVSAEVTAAGSPEALAAAATAAPGPFQPTDHEITTRPWPRAVLPSAAAGGYAVGFEGASSSSAFYPFEPQPATPPEPESQATPSSP